MGLDPDIKKLPVHLLDDENPIYSFNRAIIDATAQYAVAFKPNLAFYEAQGLKGWEAYSQIYKGKLSGNIYNCRCQAWRYRQYIAAICAVIF